MCVLSELIKFAPELIKKTHLKYEGYKRKI